MSLPWIIDAIDPHELGDAGAALFGASLFDSLYAIDARGAVTPMLADALPVSDGAGVIIKLRPGLKTGRGATLDARDAVASINRSRARATIASLAAFGKPVVAPKDVTALAIPRGDRFSIARALASPLAAIVPRNFDPRSPDGTGPFAAAVSSSDVKLTRNVNAARGAAFLDAITVGRASDLTESLRAFEAERDDVGWLGSGLFGARKDASRFDFGKVAWVTLSVGEGLGDASNPGAAQRLADDLPRDRLAHLGLGPLPAGKPGVEWSGPPAELLVDRRSPHLGETARAVAEILSAKGHEITVRTVPADELARRRKTEPVLSLAVVRPLGGSTLDVLLSLATHDDAEKAQALSAKPPKLSGESPRALTRSLRTAVLGELRVAGGVVPGVVLESADAGGWDLGASFVRAKKGA